MAYQWRGPCMTRHLSSTDMALIADKRSQAQISNDVFDIYDCLHALQTKAGRFPAGTTDGKGIDVGGQRVLPSTLVAAMVRGGGKGGGHKVTYRFRELCGESNASFPHGRITNR